MLMNVYSSLRVRYRFCKKLSEIKILMNVIVDHNNDTPKQRNSKILGFFKVPRGR